MDPSYPVTGIGCWSGGARVRRRRLRSGAYIVDVVDHLYLATWLPLWLTMPSYTSTMPVVLALLIRDGSELVPSWGLGTDQTEQELRNLNGVGANPTKQELGNLNGARADPIEHELRNLNVAGVRELRWRES
ncbi:hypothetical protein GW17_00049937 [Ensete ventricosum]|nr:hypothetical protein GW17_00049937 [Ensete ventricosum]